MQIKRIALGGIIMTVIMFTPIYACVGTVTELHHTEVWKIIFPRYNKWFKYKIEVFKGLSHGFGLGEGTVAEGWIDCAISFWEDNKNALDKR